MENIINKLYLISKKVLKAYETSDYNTTKRLIDLEYEEYRKFDIQTILSLFDYIISELGKNNMIELENYEIAFNNKKEQLILKRIFNRLNQIINRYYQYEEKITTLEKDVTYVEKNKILIMQNMDGAYNELCEKIITNIETKYLYFILENNNLDDYTKSNIFINTMYINPYLEEKIFTKNIMMDKLIKNEDNLYYNLWEYVKESYEDIIYNYCKDNSICIIETMITDLELNEQQLLIYSIYLRTLFNYLDYETLEEINNNYNEEEFDKYNILGDSYIRHAFQMINNDKEKIRQIKAH